MKLIKELDPEIFEALKAELKRQRENLELIASENLVSEPVLVAQGSIMSNKYAEGYPGKRYYGGCEFVDIAESLAIQRARDIFQADHVNVQPHSGTQANMAVQFAVLNPGDTVLAMSLSDGGHLSHGYAQNYSGKFFRIVSYGVSRKDERIDYEQVERLAQEYKPKLIIVGASAYPRIIDFERFAATARNCGAFLMADIAHIAGLVATGLHPSPVPHADFVTTTTHKTMRGARGGIIMCKKKFAKKVDSNIFPGIQGGPMMHTIAGKAVALKEAMEPDFENYQKTILENCQVLMQRLKDKGYRIATGGTDNHLFLMETKQCKGLNGKKASETLGRVNITVNKNLLPFDPEPPTVTSGLRIGTPAVTSRGMKTEDMMKIADYIDRALSNSQDQGILDQVRQDVIKLCNGYPIYEGIES